MSTSIYWSASPALRCVENQSLTLRDTLLPYGEESRRVLDHGDTQFLLGLAAGGVSGAQELVDLITEYDKIEIVRQ